MANWREMITEVMKNNDDSWDEVVMANISRNEVACWGEDEEAALPTFDTEFDSGYGGTEGGYFTVWTKSFVYFPVCYDGAEWVGSVLRNPIEGYTRSHVGG